MIARVASRALDTAADRAVEKVDPCSGQLPGNVACSGGAHRRAIDDQRASRQCWRQRVDDFPHIRVGRHTHDDGVAMAGEISWRTHRGTAGFPCKDFGLREGAIENRGEQTGLVEIGGHVSAHGTEPDEAYAHVSAPDAWMDAQRTGRGPGAARADTLAGPLQERLPRLSFRPDRRLYPCPCGSSGAPRRFPAR